MSWAMMGAGAIGMARLRELEFVVRSWSHVPRRDPDHELPAVELPDSERRAALEREITRRLTEQ